MKDWGLIRVGGRTLTGTPAHERFRAGIAYVPQDHPLFRQKTVFQNLELGCLSKS